ncbi:MAG: sulfatase, partial [Planctomyces sp.]|nr:sulfatase [Planctomyces sp.]
NCRDTSQSAPLTNEDKRAFLVNLREDEGERKNLANTRQDVVQELQQIRQEVLGTLE